MGKPLFFLYIDLATFFPKCDRSVTYFAEVQHGLPQEVADLVALLFLEKEGKFDSAHGLGDEFKMHMGLLQGCVLSPSRAKLLLNTLVVAIRAHVRGFRLWQAKGRSVEQLVYCDDWLGCLESPEGKSGTPGASPRVACWASSALRKLQWQRCALLTEKRWMRPAPCCARTQA